MVSPRSFTEAESFVESSVLDVNQYRSVVARLLPLTGVAVDDSPTRSSSDCLGREDQVDAKATSLMEVSRSIVPPRIETSLVVVTAKDVDETPRLEFAQGITLGLAHMCGSDETCRVVHVAIVRGDVEVTSHDHR
jgi:hypothetical protein